MKKVKRFFRCLHNYFFCKKYPFWKLTDSWYCYNTVINDKRIGNKNFFIKYSHTWYDDIPTGWQKAFGKKLSKEIKQAGSKYLREHKNKSWNDILSFQQIKEKWGELCLYASAIDSITYILDKYELMSIGYCICCGKPARYLTEGWISFQCEKCFEENDCWKYKGNKKIPPDKSGMIEYKAKRRLSYSNIPELTKYEYNTIKSETFKTKKDAEDKYNKLCDDPNRPNNMVYKKFENEDKTWTIQHQKQITHIINPKKEFNIDFESLWNLSDK